MEKTVQNYYDAFIHLRDNPNAMNADQWTRWNRVGKQLSVVAIFNGYVEHGPYGLKLVKMPTIKEIERLRIDACDKSKKWGKAKRKAVANVPMPAQPQPIGLVRRFIRWIW
jgi:hypothetical protein